MDIVGIGFLVLMILMGGLVAYLGDNLGRTLGKKRLSLFGIRPRRFASLTTIVAGLLIPLLTVIMVAWLSKDVRQWLLEGRQAIKDVQSLRSEQERLKEEIGDQEKQLDDSAKRLSSAQSETKIAEDRRKELDRKVVELLAKSQETLQRLASLRNRFDATSRQLGGTKTQLQKTLEELGIAESNIASARTEKDRIDKDFETAKRERDEANAEVADLNREAAELEQTIKDQVKSINDLIASRDGLRGQTDQLQRELLAQKSEIEKGRQELDELKEAAGFFRQVAENTRREPLIFARNDELARIVAPASLPLSQARAQLVGLLRSARVAAELRGAKGRAGIPAAGLMDRIEDNGQRITSDEVAAQIVSRMAGVPEERIIIAVASLNSFRNEPVSVEILSFPNKLVFKESEVIAETRIDGDLPAGEVIRRISEFLNGPVREKALREGMVPVAGAEQSLGQVTPEQVFDLVAQIKSSSRDARVQALAFQATSSADPLRLILRIP